MAIGWGGTIIGWIVTATATYIRIRGERKRHEQVMLKLDRMERRRMNPDEEYLESMMSNEDWMDDLNEDDGVRRF